MLMATYLLWMVVGPRACREEMTMPEWISVFVKELLMEPILKRMDRRENQILNAPGSQKSDDDSPVRFHIMREAIKRGKFDPSRLRSPMMMRSLLGIFKSIRDLKRNRYDHNSLISEGDLHDLLSCLTSLGIGSIGFAKVPRRWGWHSTLPWRRRPA